MYDTEHFPKARKFWHEGKFFDWSEARLHPMVHALHYGSSVFEGIRAYPTARGPAIFRLKEHLDRFLHSAEVAQMKVSYTAPEITEAIKLTVKENGLESAYIRPLLFFSYGNLGLVPKYCPVELVIGTWEWGAYLGDKTEKGVSVYIPPWRRIHHSQMDMTAKLGGLYIQSTICGLKTRALGFDECVFLNLEGNIAEGAGENVFIVQGQTLQTNDRSESILEGITRMSVLEIASDLGYRTNVAPITKDDLFRADEAFFTGTAVEVAPIIEVTDGSDSRASHKDYTIGSGQAGPVTLELQKVFRETVRGRVEKHEEWLTFI